MDKIGKPGFRKRIQNRTFHVIVNHKGTIIYSTACRKQSEAIEVFENESEMTWNEAVEVGYRSYKVFADLVDFTWESLNTNTKNGNVRDLKRQNPVFVFGGNK